MFSRVNTLLETEGAALVENHEDVIVDAMVLIKDFQKDIKSFVLNNPEEFIGENVEETFKNIRVFTEISTSQYVTEISNLYSSVIHERAIHEDRGIQEYL